MKASFIQDYGFEEGDELVPTKTTNTAEYVAVATSTLMFDVLIAKDNAHANMTMDTADVTRLLTGEGLSTMIHIGATRTTTETRATASLTMLSTSGETSAGGLPSSNSCLRW